MKVYLAGPITGQSLKGCSEWRDFARRELYNYGISGLDPLRGKQYLSNEKYIKDSYSQHVMSTAKGINRRDMNDVRQSDVILINVLGAEKVSIGTILEAGAAYALNKPIILVMEENNIHKHGMLDDMAGWIVDSLEEAIIIAAYILGAEKSQFLGNT
ncbi:MAG: nucleoside 2-deoxyribosyltransferase [Novosphingobium sp.]|nr:nucleoside 2-deoxyribosyltransferase [Novosphingobium sp.]